MADTSILATSAVAEVAVVVVNYNAGHYLERCLEATLPQVRQVIVVDNASSDDSIARCRRLFAHHPGLRIIVNAENLGFAAGCNIGCSAASLPTVMFLNPDGQPAPGAIVRLCEALYEDESIGMVGGLLINPDGSEQGGGRRIIPTPWRSFVRASGLYLLANRWPRLLVDFNLHRQPLPDRPIDVEAISGACMVVKRAALDDVGLWDEGYFLHCEDLDWCMRFRLRYWRVVFVPDAVIRHAKGVSSRGRALFVEWHKHRGMWRFYRKFFRDSYPASMMVLVALGVALRFGAVAGGIGMHRLLRLFRANGGDST